MESRCGFSGTRQINVNGPGQASESAYDKISTVNFWAGLGAGSVFAEALKVRPPDFITTLEIELVRRVRSLAVKTFGIRT